MISNNNVITCYYVLCYINNSNQCINIIRCTLQWISTIELDKNYNFIHILTIMCLTVILVLLVL